jgi:uncharacterized protein YdeI (YjbR/CyaY-like superfamily)
MSPRFFKTPGDFGKWLAKHHVSASELWVGFYKKGTGRKTITWPESVDQALCFGWIDGLRKSIDEESYMIRFTPRRPNSVWSAVNLKNFANLKSKRLIMPAGQAIFDVRKEKRTNQYSFEQGTLNFRPEYEEKLKSNKKAWAFYQSLPPSAKKQSIWYVMSAKQKVTQLRRLDVLIDSSAHELRIPQLRRPDKK